MPHISHPVIPFTLPLADGLHPGRTVEIHGEVFEGPQKEFVLEFLSGGNAAVHFNPRFGVHGEHGMVINSRIGSWGQEIRHSNPFCPGAPFTLRVEVHGDHYKFTLNGNEICTFEHRLPSASIDTVKIIGDIAVKDMHLQGFEAHHGGIGGGAQVGGIGGGVQIPSRPGLSYMTPAVPFSMPISGGFLPPKRVVIVGTPKEHANSFTVNLKHGGDISLHFNPRLNENLVVCNSFHNHHWGAEERDHPHFPFHHGKTFTLEITAQGAQYDVHVNGAEFTLFGARDDPAQVNELEIAGDVTLQVVSLQH